MLGRTPVAALAERLKETPDVTFHVEEDRLTIPERQGGFEIVFTDDGPEFTVHLGTWHHHFDTPEEAIECVLFALTAECRCNAVAPGAAAGHENAPAGQGFDGLVLCCGGVHRGVDSR